MNVQDKATRLHQDILIESNIMFGFIDLSLKNRLKQTLGEILLEWCSYHRNIDGFQGESLMGVWRSRTHGDIVWVRLETPNPFYVPVCVIIGESPDYSLTTVPDASYRAVICGLNSSMLKKESYT